MKIAEIRRYPIKSLLGERPATAEVDRRGRIGLHDSVADPCRFLVRDLADPM